MAFLDLLINSRTEDGQRLTVADLQEEVSTFSVAGHDTNASSLTWTMYLLGRHPEVQARLQQEVDAVYPEDTGVLTADHLARLTYMELVIKESMRMFPAVSMVGRRLCEDMEVAGHTVPADSVCYVMIYVMHRNPEVWPEPDVFRPERFTKENSCGRHPFAFIPFSAGPRNCIGQRFAMFEQKVLIAKFLHRFTVSTDVEECDLKIGSGLTTRPCNVRFTVRDRK